MYRIDTYEQLATVRSTHLSVTCRQTSCYACFYTQMALGKYNSTMPEQYPPKQEEDDVLLVEDWDKENGGESELLFDGDQGGERGVPCSSPRSQQQQQSNGETSRENASTDIIETNLRNSDNGDGTDWGGTGERLVEDELGGEEDVLLVGDYMPDQELEKLVVEGAAISRGRCEADELDAEQCNPEVKVGWRYCSCYEFVSYMIGALYAIPAGCEDHVLCRGRVLLCD